MAEAPERRAQQAPDGGGCSAGPARADEAAGRRRLLLGGLLLVFATSALLRWPVASIPLERDEGEYAYLAWRWLAGDVPYRDHFNQKPPGVFAVYALALRLLGPSAAAIHWFATLYSFGTLALLLRLGSRLLPLPAALAGALLAAFLSVDASLLGNSANTELFALLPLVAGSLAALRAASDRGDGWSVLAGALGGAALLFKPVVAPVLAFQLGAIVLLGRRWRRDPLLWLAGLVAVLGPVAAWFAAQGALAALWDATVVHNLAYGSGLSLDLYGGYFWAQFRGALPSVGPILAAAALAPLARAGSAVPVRRGRLWLLAWLLASLLAASAGGYFRQHYFLLAVPPLALLAGAGLDGVARRLLPRRAAWLALGAAAALLGHGVWRSPWYYLDGTPESRARRIYGSNPFPESRELGRFLAGRSQPEDRIFVYGSEPQLLFYAQRRSASRYSFVYPLTMPVAGVEARQREVLAELRAQPPRFVVGVFLTTSLLEQPGTPPALREGVRELVETGYRIAAVVPFAPDGARPIVTGAAARGLWERKPLWDGRTPWASFVVWERES